MATLKYAPSGNRLILANQWNNLRLRSRHQQILADGSPAKFVSFCRNKNFIFVGIISLVIIGAVIGMLLGIHDDLFVNNHFVVGGFFIGGAFILPLAAWWLTLIYFCVGVHVTSREQIRYGQNLVNELDIKGLKKQVKKLRLIFAGLALVFAGITLMCSYLIDDYKLRVGVCAIVGWIYCFCLYNVILMKRNVYKKGEKLISGGCSCGMVNTQFYFQYVHSYGEEETRLVDTDTTLCTIGEIYEKRSGVKVGEVKGYDTSYTYAVGNPYKSTYGHRCICCGNEFSSTNDGFRIKRRFKA